MAGRMKLGELLIEAGLIDNVQLQSALAHQTKWGMRIGAALMEMKFITERDLASFLEKQLNTQCVSIMTKELAPEVINVLEADTAKNYGVFPLEVTDKELVIATANPLDLKMLDELGFNLGLRIVPKLALESEINRAIRFYYDNIRDEVITPEVPQPPVVDQIDIVEIKGESSQMERQIEPSEITEKAKGVITTKSVLDAILTVLEKKGILSRSEVFEEIRKKQK
jgi:type IV pilus assembly protein PilB